MLLISDEETIRHMTLPCFVIEERRHRRQKLSLAQRKNEGGQTARDLRRGQPKPATKIPVERISSGARSSLGVWGRLPAQSEKHKQLRIGDGRRQAIQSINSVGTWAKEAHNACVHSSLRHSPIGGQD